MSTLQVSFRSQKVNIPLVPNTIVKDVKLQVSKVVAEGRLLPNDIKLIYKGKIFPDDSVDIYHHLKEAASKDAKVYKLMAMGLSATEKKVQKEKYAAGIRNASRIRDDLAGIRSEDASRQRLGRQMLSKRWWWCLSALLLLGSWKLDRIGLGIIFVLIIGYSVPI